MMHPVWYRLFLLWTQKTRAGCALRAATKLSAGLAVAMVVLVASVGPSGLREYWHQHRGRVVAGQAVKLIGEGRKSEALSMLVLVRPICPRQPEVLRALAQAAEEDFPVEALRCYRELEAQHQLSAADEARMAVLLVQAHDQMDGTLRMNRLVTAYPADPAVLAARDEISRQLAPVSKQRFPVQRSDLANLAAAFEPTAPLPYHPVEPLPISSPEAARRGLQSLAQSLALTPAGSDPRARRAALRRVLADSFPKAAPEVKAAMVSYLGEAREPRLILDLVTRAEALQSETLFTACLDSLAELGRHEEAASLAAAKNAPLPLSTQWTLRALMELRTPSPDRARAGQWLHAALETAKTDGRVPAMEAAGRVAFEHGLHAVAAEAFAQTLLQGGGAPQAITQYIAAARLAGVPAELVARVVATRSRQEPLSLDLAKRAAYFKLLVGNDTELVAENVSRWLANTPNDPYSHLLEAMAAYRISDYKRVVNILSHLPPCQWHKGEVAVIAGMAACAGCTADAVQLANGVAASGLFGEELKLLQKARAAGVSAPVTAMSE